MAQKRILKRFLSCFLTLALLIGLLPMSVLAAGAHGERPDDVTFKVMKMDGIRTFHPIAEYLYATKENDFYSATDLNYQDSWVQLTVSPM